MKRTNAFTIDVEDYFQVEAMAAVVSRDTWSTREYRCEKNVARLPQQIDKARIIFEIQAQDQEVHERTEHGFELGNHTYSHSSLNQVGLKAWEDDAVQGESVTRLLLRRESDLVRCAHGAAASSGVAMGASEYGGF